MFQVQLGYTVAPYKFVAHFFESDAVLNTLKALEG